MEIFSHLPLWQNKRSTDISHQLTLGFIPTMGALHSGHVSLINKSMHENDRTLVSVFVNPTQFDRLEDLETYPRQLNADIKLLKEAGVHYLLLPKYEELYNDDYRFQVVENKESHILCGAHRSGHFNGVLTVVLKLLQLSRANKCYFGEKDYQQLRLIQDMVQAFFLSVEVVGCPTIREQNGLAMSSRNQRLNEEQKKKVISFPLILKSAPTAEIATQQLTDEGYQVDYVEEKWGRRLAAVRLGDVRLIDNVILREKE